MISVEEFFQGEGFVVLPQDSFGRVDGKVYALTDQESFEMSYGMKISKTSDVNNIYKILSLVEFGEEFGHDTLIIRRSGGGYEMFNSRDIIQDIAETIVGKLVKGRADWLAYNSDPDNNKAPKDVILGSERFGSLEEVEGEIGWLKPEFKELGIQVDWDNVE